MMEAGTLTRKEAEWLIESLLAALNDLDGDTDLEDVDEDAAVDDAGCDDPHEDDEDTHDREHDPADGPEEENEHGDGDPDAEPSLGWTNQMAQGQGTWGSCGDYEQDDGI